MSDNRLRNCLRGRLEREHRRRTVAFEAGPSRLWDYTVISQATDSGKFRMLLMATLVMAIIVVTINRIVWRRLYALASTRFKLES